MEQQVGARVEPSGSPRPLGPGARFLDLIRALPVHLLPNTAGCRTAKEAITTAEMARELLETDWIKLEVIANDDTLQPDLFGLVEAATELNKRGFKVFPYMTEDLSAAERLVAAGCRVLMPWGSPIGTGRGLANPHALKTLRAYFPDLPLVIDAGIGAPSHSWFVGFAPFDGASAKIAFAVIVENAGYGGTAAARVAGEVVTAAADAGLIR